MYGKYRIGITYLSIIRNEEIKTEWFDNQDNQVVSKILKNYIGYKNPIWKEKTEEW